MADYDEAACRQPLGVEIATACGAVYGEAATLRLALCQLAGALTGNDVPTPGREGPEKRPAPVGLHPVAMDNLGSAAYELQLAHQIVEHLLREFGSTSETSPPPPMAEAVRRGDLRPMAEGPEPGGPMPPLRGGRFA